MRSGVRHRQIMAQFGSVTSAERPQLIQPVFHWASLPLSWHGPRLQLCGHQTMTAYFEP
jgi:hypothetical protein